MQKLLFIPTLILLFIGGISTVKATDVYISSDNNESAVAGFIKSVDEDVIELIVNGETLVVDVDRLDLDNGQQNILNVGDEVRFVGEFNDSEFVADSLRLLSASDQNIIVD